MSIPSSNYNVIFTFSQKPSGIRIFTEGYVSHLYLYFPRDNETKVTKALSVMQSMCNKEVFWVNAKLNDVFIITVRNDYVCKLNEEHFYLMFNEFYIQAYGVHSGNMDNNSYQCILFGRTVV